MTDRPRNSQQLLLRRHGRPRPSAEVRVGEGRRHPALRRPREESFLDQEGLVDVLDRVALFADRGGERVDAHGSAGELVDDGEKQRAIHLVEAGLVDVEESERVARDGARDPPLGAHLGEVAHAAQQPIRDPRGAARAAGELGGAVVVEGHAQDRRRAAEDALEVLAAVEVEPEGRAEAVAERRREQPRARGRADQAERLQRQFDQARRRSLPDHEVELEVLHRRVQRLLDDVIQPVDLVDEEDVPALQVGEDRGEIARPLKNGTGGGTDRDVELVGDDVRERRLAESGRPVEEDVVEDVAARAGRSDLHAQVLADRLLADVVVEGPRAERRLDDELVVERLRGDGARPAHFRFRGPVRCSRAAARSAPPIPIDSCAEALERAPDDLLEGGAGTVHLLDGALGLGALVAEVHERRDRLVDDAVRLRPRARGRAGGQRRRGLPTLDDDPLGVLLADAGDRLQARGVAGGDRRCEIRERHPGQDDERGARAEALHLAQQVEESPLALGEKPDQLDRVLADLGVDEEPHRHAGGRQVGERLERDVDGVADTADVDDEPLGGFLGERAGEGGDQDHPPRLRRSGTSLPPLSRPGTHEASGPHLRRSGGVSSGAAAFRSTRTACPTLAPLRGVRPRPGTRSRARAVAIRRASGARSRWQRATASASAASKERRGATPRRATTARRMADLSAAPWPTVASFTSPGVYSWSALSAVATAARTAPRASPRRSALCGLRATNARSTATAAGVHLPMRRTHSAWRRANRTAAVARDPSAIVPLATWRSPRPRSSTTPQPVSRLPGSMPSTRNHPSAPHHAADSRSSSSAAMSMFEDTDWTSSWSSSASRSRTICSAVLPEIATVDCGIIVTSADASGTDVVSSAVLTASNRSGAVTISRMSPDSRTSSAPASSATSMTRSSSRFRRSTVTRPHFWNIHPTEPEAPRLPPYFWIRLRTSATVRFRLSVSAWTRIATPPGPYPS